MSQLSPNSKFALTLGGAVSLAGMLLYAGWFANGLLRDIKDELSALRTDVKNTASDRWTGRDMRDYTVDLERLNAPVLRSNSQTGLAVPDVRRIQRGNREP